MKTIGVIIIGLGIILSIVNVVSALIAWLVILAGVIFLLIGYLLKK